MKVAVVGGGSTYTPELVDGVARLAGGIGITELTLVDPDTTRLEVVGPVSARIMAALGHPAKVRWTTNLDDGLDGAGAVLLQLRVGGQAARHRDESWPLEYGCVGQETTGAGGLAKALRTVPVVLDIAERARQRAEPSAWIIDFTNPVGIVTRALLDAGHRAVGLCNVAIGFQRQFAGLLGVPPERVSLDHVGLNHLTWERAVLVDGTDRLPGLLEAGWGGSGRGDRLPHRPAAGRAARGRARSRPTTCATSGPTTRWSRKSAGSPPGRSRWPGWNANCWPCTPTRRWTTSPNCSASVAAPTTPRRPWPCSPPWPGDRRDRQVVNVRNAGTLPFLPDEAVIEVPAVIGADGPRPEPVSPVSPLMRGLIGHVSAYEELAVDAARRGGRDRVAMALLAHPLVGQFDLAGRLADRLIAENAPYLPWASAPGGR